MGGWEDEAYGAYRAYEAYRAYYRAAYTLFPFTTISRMPSVKDLSCLRSSMLRCMR